MVNVILYTIPAAKQLRYTVQIILMHVSQVLQYLSASCEGRHLNAEDTEAKERMCIKLA